MFNIFRKKVTEPEISYAQACIIEVDFAGLDEFGSEEQRKKILHLLKLIEDQLKPPANVDGYEYGEGNATIYIYGPSAEALFRTIEPTLKESPFNYMTITLQYGLPNESDTISKSFSL